MKHFKDGFAKNDILLFVLPSNRPQYNGGIERGNRIFREEFYSQDHLLQDTVSKLRVELNNSITKYNTYRPHNALDGMTSMEYCENI